MNQQKETYISPFSTRYASREMQYIFSEQFKFSTWRRLWISLAKAERALGLEITEEQIAELVAHRDDINFDAAEAREKEVRHDVMSHVYAYGLQCPKAAGIIHLGATSCYVGDNTDVVILREATEIVLKKAAQVLKNLSAFADRYKSLPCLAYTHLQPAQLTTVGKRATLWMYELAQDVEELEFRLSKLLLLGSKGTTGTQASFMELFDGDEEKVRKLEEMIAADMGFPGVVPVSGQTYSRKVDAYFLSALSGVAQSAYEILPTTCASCNPSRRWKSRLSPSRSDLPPCRTRGTPCAASASPRFPAMSSTDSAELRRSPPPRSGLNARWTTPRTSAFRLPRRFWRWIPF